MSNVRTTGKKSSNTLVRDLVNVGIFSALYIGVMLILDILYGIIDPRIRLAKGGE